jgi:signal peptidase II
MGIAADLATKSWIFDRLGMPSAHPPIVLIPGIFSLTTSLNEGALFGLGKGMTFVFACLSLLAAVGILYWLVFGGASRDLWLTVALGFIMAGICGNLYDRLGMPGLVWTAPDPREGLAVYAVRDWLHFQIEAIGFDWAVFNLADSMLVTGAAMLFFHVAWREGRQKATAGTQKSAA